MMLIILFSQSFSFSLASLSTLTLLIRSLLFLHTSYEDFILWNAHLITNMLQSHVKLKSKLYNQSYFFNSLSFKSSKIHYTSICIYILEIVVNTICCRSWCLKNMLMMNSMTQTMMRISERCKEIMIQSQKIL